jgi:ABC-type polar amino acid transport system ATPase subunit
MQSPILKITGLHKSFGDNEVLKGIDLSVSKGQLVFMIGPSGSGKSTLLRCCNRLEDPSAGSILVDEVDITAAGADLNRIRQNIGMVFQHFSLFEALTVAENVALALDDAGALEGIAGRVLLLLVAAATAADTPRR